MKFSELWLREWVNTTLDSKALFNQITMAGLEVDSIEPVASEFNDVIIGEIIECYQHPNNDKLYITKINIGNSQLLDITCSAPNCRQGLKVAVSTIKKASTLCNEKSEGVLCSSYELGISDDHGNIIELPTDAPIGVDIRKYLKLDDNTIEINVTPNRADCLSIIGIARDIAVFNQTELNVPSIMPITATIDDILPIQIEVTDACPRYLARIIKGINSKVLTPLWMKEKLRRCGIRSIDAVIDVTNYVLLELGQPMHAFDKDRIDGGIIVRMAKENETLVLLNGSEVKFGTDTLVIADHNKILAMGGIFGGKYSSINSETKNVLLECAFFNPLAIVGRARRYNLCTNASHRYERGVDPMLQYRAMERTTRLLLDICGGEAGPIVDITNEAKLPKQVIIILRRSKLDRLIGHHITDSHVSDILRRMGCEVTEYGKEQWQIITPSWRFDMKIEEDLIEEIARVYGYNNIPDKLVLQDYLEIDTHSEANLSLERVKIMLNDKGYHEVITYSFINPRLQQLIHPDKEALVLLNPISSEMSVMRLSLWSGLLNTIIYNQKRQRNRIRIFEVGLRFVPNIHASLGICQDLMLAGAICGNRYEEHWDLKKEIVDFYDMKGDLESVFDLTGKASEIEFRTQAVSALHPGQSAAIYFCGEYIGLIGVLHPELECKLNLNSQIILFEIEWNKIAGRIIPQAQEISRFPANRRDIAIIVAEDVPATDVLTECKKVDLDHIVSVNLFDIYRGKGIAKGYKSLAISLILQDISRTLKEEEISATVIRCVKALKEKFRASLRD